MKEQFKNFGVIIILVVTLQSCKKDDVYYDLSESAKEILLFEVGDSFKLKNINTDEIITLTVTSKNISYSKNPFVSPLVSFGPTTDVYRERGEYTFTDTSNCYDGSIIVIAKNDEDFVLTGVLANCFGEINYPFDYQNEFFPTIDVEGIEYVNAYLLRSNPDILYYSKEKGILMIVNEFTQETRYTIVE